MEPSKVALTEPVASTMRKGHKGTITGLCFLPNNKQIVTSSLDKSIILWNLKERQESYSFSGHTGEVTEVCCSPDGKLIASCSADKTVRFWDGSLRENNKEFKAHLGVIRSVQFSPDSQHLVTASDDKTVKVWNRTRRKLEACLAGHYSWVRCARFSNDGLNIASCSDDKTTKLFDWRAKVCCTTFKELCGRPNKLAYHPTDKCLAVGLSNGILRIYDTRNNRRPVQQYQCHKDCVTAVAFHSSGNYLLSASADSTIKIIDVVEARPVYTMQGHMGPITAAAFSTDGNMFASGGRDKKLILWSLNQVLTINSRILKQKNPADMEEIITDHRSVNSYAAQPAPKNMSLIDTLNDVNRSVTKLTVNVSALEERLKKLETSSRTASFRCIH